MSAPSQWRRNQRKTQEQPRGYFRVVAAILLATAVLLFHTVGVTEASEKSVYEDGKSVCNFGGVSGQLVGGGWDSAEPLSVAACVFLTYYGTVEPFPELYVGSEETNVIENPNTDGNEDTLYPALRWKDGQMFYWEAENPAEEVERKPEEVYRHALVALVEWASDPDPRNGNDKRERVWRREASGTLNPVRGYPGKNCKDGVRRDETDVPEVAARMCQKERCAETVNGRYVATGDQMADDIIETWYCRSQDRKDDVNFLSAAAFAGISLEGVALWCVDDSDCGGSGEFVCREHVNTYPGVCFQKEFFSDTDADISNAVSIVLIVTVSIPRPSPSSPFSGIKGGETPHFCLNPRKSKNSGGPQVKRVPGGPWG